MRECDHKKFVIGVTETILTAMRTINENGRELALVEDQAHRIVGLVTDGDIRRGLLAGLTLEAPVDAIMSRDFRFVSPGEDRIHAVEMMRILGLRHVPVLDADKRLLSIHFLRDLICADPKPNLAVIMAGGRGTRLYPLTKVCPKPMVLVAGRPILERLVMHLVGHGIRNIFLSVNYLSEVIEDYFQDGARFGCHLRYLREEKPLGTGGSLSLLPEKPTCPIVVMNGDQVTQTDVTNMLAFHRQEGVDATIGMRPYNVEIPFGVVEISRNRLVGLTEKPIKTYMVSTGIYILSPGVLSLIPHGEEYPITHLFKELHCRDRPVGAYLIEEDWIDVGTPRDLGRANGIF